MVESRRDKLNPISCRPSDGVANPNKNHGEDIHNLDVCSPSTSFSDVVVRGNNDDDDNSSDKEDDGPAWGTWRWVWAWTGEKSVGWGFGDERGWWWWWWKW
jgi:hypothetical protein